MKKVFSRKNSKLILFLLIFILILSVRSGKYTYLVNILFFWTLLLYYRTHLTSHTFYYLVIFVFLTLWGLIHRNSYISMIEDLLSFSPFILLFIERPSIKSDLFLKLPKFLVHSLNLMIPLSILIFVYMDYGIGSIQTTRFNYNSEIKFGLFGPIIPIIFGPTLIFFSDRYNNKEKILVYISMILVTLMGVITLSKSVIASALFPLLIFYGYKTIRIDFRSLTKSLVLIGILILVSLNFGIFKKNEFASAVGDTIERASQQREDNRFSSGRYEETLAYLNQNLDLGEYLIGRGMGGHKVRNDSDFFIGGVNMMHFGPTHVFMKGGILLIIVLYLPMFLAIFKFWGTPNYPISLILLSFFIGNIQTSTWSWGLGVFLYWYGISMYFTSKQKVKAIIRD